MFKEGGENEKALCRNNFDQSINIFDASKTKGKNTPLKREFMTYASARETLKYTLANRALRLRYKDFKLRPLAHLITGSQADDPELLLSLRDTRNTMG